MDRYTPLGTTNGNPETPSDELPDRSEAEVIPEAETTSQTAYLKTIMPPSKPKRKKWPLMALLTVLIAAILAGGSYWYVKHHQASKPAAPKTSTAQSIQPATVSNGGGTTAHYISNGNDLKLDFDYPSSWTVTPPSNANSNDQTITLTSPFTSMTSASGAAVTGKSVIMIRPGTAQLSELSNSAIAAQASVQIAYSKPTAAQHQYPYLTFLHLGSGSSASFQEVLVTGTLQFTQGETITSSSLSVDPIISASFYSCTTQTCTGSGAVPMSITNQSWQNDAVFQQTLAVLESMQLN